LMLETPGERGGVEQAALQQHGAETFARLLPALGFGERAAVELAGTVEHLADALLGLVATRVDDLAAAEVDRLLDRLLVLVRDEQQHAVAAAHVEQREEVGDAEPLDAAVERQPLGGEEGGRAGGGRGGPGGGGGGGRSRGLRKRGTRGGAGRGGGPPPPGRGGLRAP